MEQLECATINYINLFSCDIGFLYPNSEYNLPISFVCELFSVWKCLNIYKFTWRLKRLRRSAFDLKTKGEKKNGNGKKDEVFAIVKIHIHFVVLHKDLMWSTCIFWFFIKEKSSFSFCNESCELRSKSQGKSFLFEQIRILSVYIFVVSW